MSEQLVKVTIPQSWDEITLETYLKYRKTIDMYKEDVEAEEDDKSFIIALDILCGIKPDMITQIPMDKLKIIQQDLIGFIGKADFELERFITIDNVEYGFEPNLAEISYGAYLDISKHDTISIDKNWTKIMSILYRPIVKKDKNYYEIQTYTGKEDDSVFLKTNMRVNFGCLFFFINTSKDLQRYTQKSLMAEQEILHLFKSITGKSGEGILRLLNSQTETS